MSVEKYRISKGAVGAREILDQGIGTSDIDDDAITTAKIADGAVTKGKVGYKVVTVTVSSGATSGSSSADSELVGGEIVGVYPAGNQDQFINDISLNSDGSITITLAAAATADNTFKVVVLKP